MRKEALEEIKKIESETEILIECLKLKLKISSLGDEYFYNIVVSLARE